MSSEKERDQVLESLVRAIDKVYESRRHLFARSFMAGLFSGLGATIGVAIVVALLTLIINTFGGVPFLGDLLSGLGTYLPD